MATGILILFCVAILNFGISASSKLTLKHVVVTYRSGEHTPCDFWAVPKITNVSESNSTLTTPGVTRAYNLGQTLGQRYKDNFSLSEWTSEHYYSMGTRAPRCLMSAFNFGAGLEKNESKKVSEWKQEQIERAKTENVTFPHTDQYMMFLNTTKCPAFYTALAQELQTSLKAKLDQYSSKITDVTRYYTTVNTSQPYTVWLGYEILQSMNKSIPQNTTWIKNSTWEGLEDYSEEYIFGVESAEKLKKLSGGIMLDSIFNVTQDIIDGKQPKGKNAEHSHKISALATSQAPLAAMLGAFNTTSTTYNGSVFDAEKFYPRDGAHHVVEIYEDSTSSSRSSSRSSHSSSHSSSGKNYKVRVLYAPGGGNDELIPLKYSECGEGDMCTFDKLKETLNNVRLHGKDQEKECKPQSTQ